MTLVWSAPRGQPNEYVELLTQSQGPQSAQALELDSDAIIVPDTGETVTQALDDIENDLAADVPNGLPGYRARFVWVNPASDRIGTPFAGVLCTAAPAAWLTEADVPPGNVFDWVQFGSAGGSGSGSACRNASGTGSFGAGGPSGGAYRNAWRCARKDIIEALPIFFTTPLGGLGGASVVSTSISASDGLPGLSGAMNLIVGTGLRQSAGGGGPGGAGGGAGGQGSSGAGGGMLGNGTSGASGGGAPPDPMAQVSNTVFYNLGGGASQTRVSTGASGVNHYPINGGAGGGISGSGIVHGGRSKHGGSGGGGGGRYSLVSGLINSVGEGGNHDIENFVGSVGGGGGAAATLNGQNGGNGRDGSYMQGGEGGGGGFGGFANIGNASGGAGGFGGFPGGGSGGGGAAFLLAPTGSAISGPGRKGGDAATILTILI